MSFSKDVSFILGDMDFWFSPKIRQPFCKEVVSCLADMSTILLSSKNTRNYPDIINFAYWCRKANLKRLEARHYSKHLRIGRGSVFHLTPSNVPVNFAFSLAFGLLAGNTNLVRVSNLNLPQVTMICNALSCALIRSENDDLRSMAKVISYPRNDDITKEISASSDARVIWGGDVTVSHIRSMLTRPRCVDICFADRFSMSVLGAQSVLDADDRASDLLFKAFVRDAFLFEQSACSSPHLILWQGGKLTVEQAKMKFWRGVGGLLRKRQAPPINQAIERFSVACEFAIQNDSLKIDTFRALDLLRIELDKVPANIDQQRGRFGLFFEANDNSLKQFTNIVNSKYQTVTYYGVDPEEIVSAVLDGGLHGVDRVVPIGDALNMDALWDGFDMIEGLSRILVRH